VGTARRALRLAAEWNVGERVRPCEGPERAAAVLVAQATRGREGDVGGAADVCPGTWVARREAFLCDVAP
jgi:hypothetical protein